MVGPREPGALERLLVGTIATRVMRAAHCPVIVPRHVGARSEEKPRLVVGVDVDSSSFKWLVQQAGEWAVSLNGTLDAVYMTSSAAVTGIRNAYVREAAMKEWVLSQEPTRAKIADAMSTIPPANRGEAKVIAGDPENDLVGLSKDYDFIVVGNLEHSGIRVYLLGTVASHVVRSAQCDVITLPAAAYLEQL